MDCGLYVPILSAVVAYSNWLPHVVYTWFWDKGVPTPSTNYRSFRGPKLKFYLDVMNLLRYTLLLRIIKVLILDIYGFELNVLI